MPSEDLHNKPFRPETITKLEIFEQYLEAWLPVFIHSKAFSSINICDFFAGTGQDKNGIPGSPLRILYIINKFSGQIKDSSLKIKIILNEFDENKYIKLKTSVDSESERLKLDGLLEIEYYNEDFSKLYNRKKHEIRNSANLLFLDQNGIKHVTHDIYPSLVDLKVTDFLFFISSSYFKRFIGDESFKKHFPDIDASKIEKAKQSEVHKVVLEYYKDKLPPGNTTKLYPFTLKKERNIYGLIFGSKHVRGVDKFLEIAWRKNSVNGSANFDIDEDYKAKQDDFFVDNKLTKIEKFHENLEVFITSRKIVTNKDIYDYTLEHGHIPKHAVEKLKMMKSAKRINYATHPHINYNSCYKTDLVTFCHFWVV